MDKTSPDEKRILVISDLHNNVISIELASKLAELFDVSMVVNAGDLTDLGSHYEKEVALALKKIKRPQLFVSGNHDSPEVVSAVKQVPEMNVLMGQDVTVSGVHFLGLPDPSSLKSGLREVESSSAQIADYRKLLLHRLITFHPKPDVVIIHDPKIAASAIGKVPVFISGHTHTVQLEQRQGTVLINPGTTGAAGIRYFINEQKPPITAMILHVVKQKTLKVKAVDLLEFNAPKGEYSLRHKRLPLDSTGS
jgi:putative phosphoesterase